MNGERSKFIPTLSIGDHVPKVGVTEKPDIRGGRRLESSIVK